MGFVCSGLVLQRVTFKVENKNKTTSVKNDPREGKMSKINVANGQMDKM